MKLHEEHALIEMMPFIDGSLIRTFEHIPGGDILDCVECLLGWKTLSDEHKRRNEDVACQKGRLCQISTERKTLEQRRIAKVRGQKILCRKNIANAEHGTGGATCFNPNTCDSRLKAYSIPPSGRTCMSFLFLFRTFQHMPKDTT